MVITESLAKGLRGNFWQLLEKNGTLLERRIEPLALGRIDPKNSRHVQRFLKELTEAAKLPSVLQQGVYGRKHHSVWWAMFVQPDRARPVAEDWTEACLRIDIHRVYLQPQDWKFTFLPVLLGEHCISRLFQRLPWKEIPRAQDILPEIREFAINFQWSSLLDALCRVPNPGLAQTLFIPTRHGVFLGCHNPTDSTLFEVRTFVSKDQLTRRQLALWTELRRAQSLCPLANYTGHILMETNEAQSIYMRDCQPSLEASLRALASYQDVLDVELVRQDLPTVEELGYLPADQRGNANPAGLARYPFSKNDVPDLPCPSERTGITSALESVGSASNSPLDR